MIDFEKSERAKKAMDLFKQGYNCCQAVTLAFDDKFGDNTDIDMVAKMTSSFGGGIGGMREVCGAVNGMAAVFGILYGHKIPENIEEKKKHYGRIQKAAEMFKEENGSIICRELLNMSKNEVKNEPSLRTAEYYKKRPCVQLVGIAAAIIEKCMD